MPLGANFALTKHRGTGRKCTMFTNYPHLIVTFGVLYVESLEIDGMEYGWCVLDVRSAHARLLG